MTSSCCVEDSAEEKRDVPDSHQTETELEHASEFQVIMGCTPTSKQTHRLSWQGEAGLYEPGGSPPPESQLYQRSK